MFRENIIVIGSGGHAKSVADMIMSALDYSVAGFIDRKTSDKPVYIDCNIIGTDDDIEKIYKDVTHYAVMGIGYMGDGDLRKILYEKYKKSGFEFPVIMDRVAGVAEEAQIAEGVVIGKCAVVNSDAKIGKLAIINSGAIVEHDCVVGDFVHLAVGATLCGNVTVGEGAFIGARATVLQGLKIGKNAIVGAGSLVLRDVLDNEKVMGLVK